MGKHRHKKSFYDVEEDELQSSPKHRHHQHHHHHHRRRSHSSDRQEEVKQQVPFISSLGNGKIDDDEAALQSPPTKRQRSSSNGSQSPSKVLSQLIEDPEFLANAGPKAKEFAETARQLLSKPDLDPMTQQIICAMTQAAVNVGKRLSSSSSSTPADQCVDELSLTSTTYSSSSTLLSPTLSNTSSSSASSTPQPQFNSTLFHEESKTPMAEPESDEDILIKQMIERAMKLTQQGDIRHAQHLLGIIHQKLSNKRKRAATSTEFTPITPVTNSNKLEKPKFTSTTENLALSPSINEDSSSTHSKVSPNHSEQSNNLQNLPHFLYPAPPPPLPPPPPPPTSPPVPVPPIEQVQELLSNPSELQDILKKLRSVNENQKILPPEEYQIQSHIAPLSPYYSQAPPVLYNYSSASRPTAYNNQIPRVPQPLSLANDPQPYNSSLAFMQGNRRSLPPLQTTERCFSSSITKNKQHQQPNRSFPYSSSNNNVNVPLPSNQSSHIQSAPPLMKINPAFTFPPSTPILSDATPPCWPTTIEAPQRSLHPFWCATCSLGFPHQVAYQEHLGSHVPCTVPGCSYAASEQLVRLHHANIHENNARSRMNNQLIHPTHPLLRQQHSLELPWPLMRM